MNRSEAGRKGGLATLKKYGKRYFKRLGRWGGHMMHVKNALVPVGQNDFAITDRETGIIKGYLSGRKVKE